MEDEKGQDEKILCVLEEDCNKIKDIQDVSDEIKDIIFTFFSEYKNNMPDKWSKVDCFKNKEYAIKLYEQSHI